jgi:hypothetical protein
VDVRFFSFDKCDLCVSGIFQNVWHFKSLGIGTLATWLKNKKDNTPTLVKSTLKLSRSKLFHFRTSYEHEQYWVHINMLSWFKSKILSAVIDSMELKGQW